jgi:NitT/TauT family transport system substrate-binding protein
VVNLLADNGYTSYTNIVLTQSRTVADHPEIVKAFIEASIEGWYSYIHGDPKPGNELILRDNKEMTQDTIDGAIRLMKQYGIVDSGDSLTLGIGAMTDARWQSFFKTMALAGLYKPDLDYKKAYTLQFVDAKYGMATTAK